MSASGQELLRDAAARHRAGDLAGARTLYERVLTVVPNQPDALHLLGLILHQQGDSAAGRRLVEAAIAARPGQALFHANLGRLLRAAGEPAEAETAWREALRLAPGLADAAMPLARLVRDAGRNREAQDLLDAALQASPEDATLSLEAGETAQALGRPDVAIEHYMRAAAQGETAPILTAIATSLFEMGRLADALAQCEAALALDPDMGPALWMRTVLRAALCDWRGGPPLPDPLAERIAAGRLIPQPFTLLSLSDDRALQRRAAEQWIARHAPAQPALLDTDEARVARTGKQRLRVGYLSSELRAHAMGWLMAGLFEAHDKDRFEIAVYGYGKADGSEVEARIRAAVDDWIDIRALPHRAAAQRIHDDGVDLLIDLKAHTADARPQILAARPAPIQVNWLGYPGTSGAPYLDYLLADAEVIRPGEQDHYSEAVVTLPDSYQVTDPARAIAAEPATREAAGLPARGFVFCCFNGLHKITPAVFARWCALLRGVEGSLLWLLAGPEAAQANLRRHLAGAGLDPGRLVFAPRLDQGRHLARHRLADLFLDTLPYGAHTGASDALWAGLPLVTCRGASFPGRVGASLLTACGLPELIAGSLEDYQALALALARDPARLAALRVRLAAGRAGAALFDCARFTRHLEAAYAEMWHRWLAGAPPEAFAVEPRPGPARKALAATARSDH